MCFHEGGHLIHPHSCPIGLLSRGHLHQTQRKKRIERRNVAEEAYCLQHRLIWTFQVERGLSRRQICGFLVCGETVAVFQTKV